MQTKDDGVSADQRDAAWDKSRGDPRMLRLTEQALSTPDAAGVDTSADMFLIFLAAGGTILGCVIASMLYLTLAPVPSSKGLWLTWMVVSGAVGGILGCLAVMAILGMKGLVRWERQHRQKS